MHKFPFILAFFASAWSIDLTAQSIYGLKAMVAPSPGVSQAPTMLFKYDHVLTTYEVIGMIQVDSADLNSDGLAFTPMLGLIAFEHLDGGSRMIMIDTVTAEAIPIGGLLPDVEISGACWDQGYDVLAIDRMNDALLRIDGEDGDLISSIPLTHNGSQFALVGGDIAYMQNKFYLHQTYTLFEVDTLTGILTEVWIDGISDATDDLGLCQNNSYPPNVGGIAAAPAIDQHTYIALDGNCEEDLYSYSVITPNDRAELIHDVSPELNSGNLDLATAVDMVSIGMEEDLLIHRSIHAAYEEASGLTVSAISKGLGEVAIYDAMGRMITKQNAGLSNVLRIAIQLRSGSYLVRTSIGSQRIIAP